MQQLTSSCATINKCWWTANFYSSAPTTVRRCVILQSILSVASKHATAERVHRACREKEKIKRHCMKNRIDDYCTTIHTYIHKCRDSYAQTHMRCCCESAPESLVSSETGSDKILGLIRHLKCNGIQGKNNTSGDKGWWGRLREWMQTNNYSSRLSATKYKWVQLTKVDRSWCEAVEYKARGEDSWG